MARDRDDRLISETLRDVRADREMTGSRKCALQPTTLMDPADFKPHDKAIN
ncbi:peptidase S10 serine carboxypeptidase [Anopheles sinensis]|uniref:Peptidase S10 serine carboxypeptidase n=1 Tax=Anopheles sinensis TaxID=74873 RepID=A0A084WLN7_ANOSI|nr:peptidase S10 serine carboxypeptidase [Anopheles sinensis]